MHRAMCVFVAPYCYLAMFMGDGVGRASNAFDLALLFFFVLEIVLRCTADEKEAMSVH